MNDKATIGIVCFVGGVVSVYVVAKIFRSRIRTSIADSVTGRVCSSISTIIPGGSIPITGDVMNVVATNVSYPVADGVLQGLML